jgi:serine/threonine protein kinase
VAEGVSHLHHYHPVIIHGDLKPVSTSPRSRVLPNYPFSQGNILIDDSGNPRICDFGLARIFLDEGNSGMTTTTPHTGTDRYLAYELVMTRDASVLSTASDVYALGCVGLYVGFSYFSRGSDGSSSSSFSFFNCRTVLAETIFSAKFFKICDMEYLLPLDRHCYPQRMYTSGQSSSAVGK